jgi:hypothetical protein
VGLSSIDGYDAANNMTGTQYRFASGWRYDIRLRVTDKTTGALRNIKLHMITE